MPYSTVRTYYSRIYEGKFITGAIAGALADNNRIGYVGSYPIFGVPASINAFALGAQLTNPRAQIELKWSCMPGNPTQEFIRDGIRVISNRDTPAEDKLHTEYGTYYIGGSGEFIPLGSPCWIWGKFYENVIRAILSGTWDDIHGQAVNDWWGMSSGVIDVKLAGRSAGGHQESGALPAQRHQKRNDRPLPQEDRRTGRRSQERWHTDAWGGRPASHGLAVRECPRRDSRL